MEEIVFQDSSLVGWERYEMSTALPVWRGDDISELAALDNSRVRVMCDTEIVERTLEICHLQKLRHQNLITLLDASLSRVNPLTPRVVLCGPHWLFEDAVRYGLVPSKGAFFELFRRPEK